MTERLVLRVNGACRHVVADPTAPLLAILRNHLGLTGTRFGCGQEKCGVCVVLVDGAPVYACSREAGTVVGCEVTTVEGLGRIGDLHPLQQAFLDEQAGQCGYCLSGILLRAKALLDQNPDPDRSEIAAALDDHLCRCGSHVRILRAVARAARAMREGAS